MVWLACVVGAAQSREKCRDGRRAWQEMRDSGLRALGVGKCRGLAEALAIGSARAKRQGTEAQARMGGGGGGGGGEWGRGGFLLAWADEQLQGLKLRYYSEIEALYHPAN